MTTPPAAFSQFGQALAFAERTLTATLRLHLAERGTTPETWYALQLIATRGPALARNALTTDLEGSRTLDADSTIELLTRLEDEGLITSASDGGKKLFTLTDPGRTEAEAGPDAPWEEAGRGVDWESLHEIRKAGGGLVDAFRQVWATGTPEQREKALAVVNEARKKLYLILADED